MASIELNHGNVPSSNAKHGAFGDLLADLRVYMSRRAVYRQTVRELNSLNGRDLADLGIQRTMIRSIARDAAWGTK